MALGEIGGLVGAGTGGALGFIEARSARKSREAEEKRKRKERKRANIGRALKGFGELEQRKAQGLASLAQAASDFSARVR